MATKQLIIKIFTPKITNTIASSINFLKPKVSFIKLKKMTYQYILLKGLHFGLLTQDKNLQFLLPRNQFNNDIPKKLGLNG